MRAVGGQHIDRQAHLTSLRCGFELSGGDSAGYSGSQGGAMSRGCRVMLAGLVAVLGVAATSRAGAMYQNSSGAVARAVRIEFSEPAEITSM